MKTVHQDMIVGDILDLDQGTAQFFAEIGMHCLGCPSSRGETLAQACAVHDENPEKLVDRINAYLANA